MADSGAIRAGRAFIELFSDDSKLKKGLAIAAGNLKQWGERISSIGSKVAIIGGSMLAPIVSLTHQFMEMGKAGKLTGDDLATYKSLKTTFDSLHKSAMRIAAALASALAPVLQELAVELLPIVQTAAKWIRENKELVALFVKIGAVLVAVGGALVIIGHVVSVAAVGFAAISTVVGFLMTPLGAMLVVLTALGAAWLFLTESGGKFRGALGKGFGTLGETLDAILRALKGGQLELAWKIALKGMQVAWLEFANELGIQNWLSDFKMGLLGIRKFWAELMADMHKGIALLLRFNADTGGLLTGGRLDPTTSRVMASQQERKAIEQAREGRRLQDEMRREVKRRIPDGGLAKARQELDDLIGQIKPRLVNAPLAPIEGESQGTFNAFAAARGSGVSGLLQRQVDLLQDIRDAVEEGGLVVG